MPSACARSTGAARISDDEPPVGVRRDESSLRQTLAAEVLPNVQRVVWPRGDLASQETGRVASQHGKLGRAGLLDEVAVPTVRSRDAAVSLVSGPRSQLAARSRKPGSVSRREYPPSDRASSATGVRVVRVRRRSASCSRPRVPESLHSASSIGSDDPFHITLDVSLESVQARQLRRLEGAAGQQRGHRAGEEARRSEDGV